MRRGGVMAGCKLDEIDIMATAQPLILDGITKTYGSHVALRGVTLSIQPGEMMFLLGSSGCGKTTLLRIIAGLLTQDQGTIICDGRDISPLPANRRGFGYVFQNYALFPHRTIGENVAFGLRVRKIQQSEIERRVLSILRQVRLHDQIDKYPRQLSGGQQQRVALARALVIEPPVLLLDEPLSNLDAKLREEMRYELRALQQRVGVTTVFVTHDQEEALSMGDRIAVMEGGVVHQCDSPRDVYASPKTDFVARFVGRANNIDGVLTSKECDGIGVIRDSSEREFRARLLDGDTPVGATLKLLVRPECVWVNNASDGHNRVNARYRSGVFFGSTSSRFFDLNAGLQFEVQDLSLRQQNVEGGAGEVMLSWDPFESVLVNPSPVTSSVEGENSGSSGSR